MNNAKSQKYCCPPRSPKLAPRKGFRVFASLFNIKKIKNDIIIHLFGIRIRHHKHNKNHIILVKKNGKKTYNPKIKGLKFHLKYGRNIIKIYEPCPDFKNCNIYASGNTSITIKSSKHYIHNFSVDMRCGNSKLFINENFSIVSGNFFIDYGSKLEIGRNCMMSDNVSIRTGDAHTVINKATGELITPKDVIIGDNVWVGLNATILKNSYIPSNCIVGTNALVTKKFSQEYCALGGNPTKIVKENVFWDREPYYIRLEKQKKTNRLRTLS